MVLQCINGVGSNPVEGRTTNLTALKFNSNTVWFNFQMYIYIYIHLFIHQLDIDKVPQWDENFVILRSV